MISCKMRYLRDSHVRASAGQLTKLSLCWPNASFVISFQRQNHFFFFFVDRKKNKYPNGRVITLNHRMNYGMKKKETKIEMSYVNLCKCDFLIEIV